MLDTNTNEYKHLLEHKSRKLGQNVRDSWTSPSKCQRKLDLNFGHASTERQYAVSRGRRRGGDVVFLKRPPAYEPQTVCTSAFMSRGMSALETVVARCEIQPRANSAELVFGTNRRF